MKELEREIQELREMMRSMYDILVTLTLTSKDYSSSPYSPKIRKKVIRRLAYAKKTLEIKNNKGGEMKVLFRYNNETRE
ncbi:MAG: hypothetical protein QXX84_07015 [Sulfolobales archaeon]